MNLSAICNKRIFIVQLITICGTTVLVQVIDPQVKDKEPLEVIVVDKSKSPPKTKSKNK